MQSFPLTDTDTLALPTAVPQVAIIVPLYNVAPYLSRCIESLVAQTLSPLEIVLVDDGSTDASGAIADWYAERHPQIRVLHQENRGQGAARNAGLAASNAPFVCFVDSDDYVAADYAEKLLTGIRRSHADIAVCTYETIFQIGLHKRPLLHRLLPGTLTGARALRLILRDASIKNYTWNKLFRRTLFTERNIEFPSICFEDLATMPRVFSRARRVEVIQDRLYFYCRRPTSLLNVYTPRRVDDNIRALSMVREFLTDTRQFKRHRGSFYYLIQKFALYVGLSTLCTHWQQHLPGAWQAARAAYWRTFDLTLSEHVENGLATQADNMLELERLRKEI